MADFLKALRDAGKVWWTVIAVLIVIFGGSITGVILSLPLSSVALVAAVVSGLALAGILAIIWVRPQRRLQTIPEASVRATPKASRNGEWAWIDVNNDDTTDEFEVQIEWLDTGRDEHPYRAPWRDGKRTMTIKKGGMGTINVASVNLTDMNALIRQQATGKAMLWFHTTENPDRVWTREPLPVGSDIRCRVKVLRANGEPLPPFECLLEIVTSSRLRFTRIAG